MQALIDSRTSLPVAPIETLVRARLASRTGRRPVVLGLSGPQGSGKSTLATALALRFATHGIAVALLSIDDLYLDRRRRRQLAQAVHPLLRTRGVPGTHDVTRALTLFQQLGEPGRVMLPRFDKATDEPRPVDRWPIIDAPVDVVLFEGWCVGARPLPDDALAAPISAFEAHHDPDGRWRRFVNAQLAGPYAALFARIDLNVLLTAPDFETVVGWRIEQEHALRQTLAARGADPGRTMDDDAVRDFVEYFRRITLAMLAEMPARADVTIALDGRRRPVRIHGPGGAPLPA